MASRTRDYADQLANAVVSLVREGIGRFDVSSSPVQAAQAQAHASQSPGPQTHFLASTTPRPTPYQRASSIVNVSSSRSTRLEPPTMFRSRRNGLGKKKSQRPICYVRDIMCLPMAFKPQNESKIIIPRGKRRATLAESGLVGKIQFTSIMVEVEIQEEVCRVFATAMGLSSEDIAQGKLFPFSYLQRTGAGSRSLCLPSVSSTFQWNGKEVASLAKSGGCIYILAGDELKGFESIEEDLVESDQSGDDREEVHMSQDFDLLAEPSTSSANITLHRSLAQTTPDRSEELTASESPGKTITDSSGSSLLESSVDGSIPGLTRRNSLLNLTGSSSSTGGDSLPALTESSSTFDMSTSDSDLCDLDRLLRVYAGHGFSAKQVLAIFRATDGNLEVSVECLSKGGSLGDILHLLQLILDEQSANKLKTSDEDFWADMVTYYKSSRFNSSQPIRIQLSGQPALDTGGVRNTLYSVVFQQFASNKHVRMFDGYERYLRPMCTAESRSSGLWRILGKMIAHSIAQCGVGFPYFSHAMYWYIADGEERSLQYLGLQDVGTDIALVITKLKDAVSDDELRETLCEELTIDILAKCDIATTVSMATKDVIAQSILTYEGLYKLSKMMDLLADGLKCNGVLKLVRAFPHHFISLFTYTGVSPEDVLDVMSVDPDSVPDVIIVKFFKRYVTGCTEHELNALLMHVTGSTAIHKICIEFVDYEDQGAITAHTCAGTIVFPRNIFTDDDKSYELFKQALQAVIDSPSLAFNIV